MQIKQMEHQKYVGMEQGLRKYRDELLKQMADQRALAAIDAMIRRIDVVKRVQMVTGVQFDIGTRDHRGETFIDSSEPKIAAFVEPQKGFKGTIMEDTLDLPEHQVMQIATHERIHQESKIVSLNPGSFLEKEDYSALLEYLDVKELSEKDLVEGFTDTLTNRRVGKNELSAYQKREVPLAEKLEKLGREKLQISLCEIFSRGPAEVFQYHLRNIAREILIEQEILKQMENNLSQDSEFKKLFDSAIAKERNFLRKASPSEIKKSVTEVIKQTVELLEISKSLKIAA